MITAAPNPIRCGRTSDSSRVDRDLSCAHYDDCLDRACREGWSGFSCRECPLHGRARTGALDVEAFIAGPGNHLMIERKTPVNRGITPSAPVKGGFYLDVFARFTAETPRWSYRELAAAMGQPESRVGSALAHLVARAMVARVAPGTFELPKKTGETR